MKSIEQQFRDACEAARVLSDANGCAEHVNARVAVVDGCPAVVAFEVSDWFVTEATVATFNNGRERS